MAVFTGYQRAVWLAIHCLQITQSTLMDDDFFLTWERPETPDTMMRRLDHEVMTPTHLFTSRVPGRWADIMIWKQEPVHDYSSDEDDHSIRGYESPYAYREEEESSERGEGQNEKEHHKNAGLAESMAPNENEVQNSKEDLEFLRERLVTFIEDTYKLKGNHPEAAKELLEGAEELKMIHTLMLEDIKDLPLSVVQENPLNISRRKMLNLSLEKTELNWSNQDNYHRDRMGKYWVKQLNDILHKVAPFDIEIKIDIENHLNVKSLELQRLVLQTVDYMFQKEWINKENFIEFFKKDDTLEVAAINMIVMFLIKTQWQKRQVTVKSILNSWYSAHAKNMFEELDYPYQRRFSYVCHKLIYLYQYENHVKKVEDYQYKNFEHKLSYLLEVLFKDKIAFNTLEKYFYLPASKEAMEDFHKENPYFIEMKDALLKMQILFMEIQNQEETEEEKEHFIILHQVLELILENYGHINLGNEQPANLFHKKMRLGYFGIDLIEELDHIDHYLFHRFSKSKRQSREFERIWELNRLDDRSKVEELWLIENEIKIKFQRYHDFLRFAYNHEPINQFCFPQQVQHKIKHLRTKIKFFQELYGYFYV
ncbi:hypothetical protein PGTUg99_017228 [Puccinia graminis f. sp. tritici]|uniref:Uncharacterized protein n=1 Tax=Puccinia graminis f. sp. tritici TaxID=56615 RepID=A0A5B0RTR7_PUCGR|nr:hypothetical protein PGTUg99_017228 [Puccinia graminis f. sp. tritici]